MSIVIKIAGVDVSSYVVDCDKIPVVNRNRNWELVAAGFNVNIWRSYEGSLANGSAVEVLVDGDEVYLGFVKYSKKVEDTYVYQVEVQHEFMKLDEKLVQYGNLHSVLNGTSLFGSPVSFTADPATDYLAITGHGLSDGTRIQVRSAGTLPAGLEANHYYYLRSVDADHIKLYATYSDYIVPNPIVNITSAGTGAHSFAVIGDTELNLYNDNADGSSNPHFTLAWLIKKLLGLISLTVDYSAIDTVKLFSNTVSGSDYTYNWNEILFNENMLWAINQDKATDYAIYDGSVDYKKQKISCLDLLRTLCGIFGWAFIYTGSSTYKIYGAARDASTGDLSPDDEPLYAIEDSDKWEYESYTVEGNQAGYIYSRKHDQTLSHYKDPLAEHELTEYDETSTQDGDETISWFSNLRIFLKDKTTANPGVVLEGFDLDATMEYTFGKAIYNYVAAIQFNFDYERIVTEIDLSIPTVKEINLILDEELMEVVQEENTLVSP